MRKKLSFKNIILITMLILNANQTVIAGSKIVPLKGISYSVKVSMEQNLENLKGNIVTLYLESDVEIVGNIKEVNGDYVHLEKLTGKENFDALIRVSKIIAISTQFREYQR